MVPPKIEGVMVGDESAGVFAGYRIEGLIRHGGMASVYRARHLVLQRAAAVKVLAPALARDQRFRARFLGESRTAASLDHPHIVPIYDAGEADGALFIAMRLIEGSDLGTLLGEAGRLEPPRVVEILGQVAGALDAAHGRGLVHRDVKPSNILISGAPGSEHAYLTDFGITKELAAEGMTGTAEFVGTLAYMSPEQIEGMTLDGRADVYALGCVLHECLTGATPFGSDTLVGVMHAHLTKPPPRPTVVVPSLPEGLDAVVATAMAKRPDDRYPTCAAMVDAARAALTASRRPPAPPVFVASTAAATPPAPPPAARRPVPGGGGGGWMRRWPALLTAAAALLLVAAVAAGSLRGSPTPAPTPGPQTGLLPGYSPVPLSGGTPTASPATPSATARGAPANHPVVVTVNASPSAAAHPTATPAATAGPPSPSAAGPPSPTPTAASVPGGTPWPASPPTNSRSGCEPAWSWSCVPVGNCKTVAVYGDSGTLPATPEGRAFPTTVGSDGYFCAAWRNPGVQGALIGPDGKPVSGASGANAGIVAYGLPPGNYTLALRLADASYPNHTSLQINHA